MGAQFPSEDGLAHVAWTEVYRALGAADSVWRQFYERGAQWNTPNLSYFGLQYALGAVVSPYVAQQLIVSALVVLWVASTYALSRALTGRISIGAFASLLLVHSSWLYGGYFSFLFGVPPLLLSLALVVRIVDPSTPAGRRDFVALAVLGVLAYYSHIVDAATFLMLLFITAAFLRRSPRRAVGVGIAAAPVALLFASYLLADSLGAGGLRWEPAGKTIARFVGLAFFRGFAAPSVLFWIALPAFAAIVFVLCLDTARTYWRRDPEPDPDHDRLSVAAPLIFTLVACLAVLYFVSPDGIGFCAETLGLTRAEVGAVATFYTMYKRRPAGDWLVILYLGVFQIGLAYVCLAKGMAGVPALEASLLLLLEPVLNPVWSWVVHGEAPGSRALIGGAIILVATAARTIWDATRN